MVAAESVNSKLVDGARHAVRHFSADFTDNYFNNTFAEIVISLQ